LIPVNDSRGLARAVFSQKLCSAPAVTALQATQCLFLADAVEKGVEDGAER
jgi:hypothetical protein